MIPYPEIDPVAVALGPVKIRWYGLMYLVGFAAAWALLRSRAGKAHFLFDRDDVEDIVFFGAVGLIVGARVGYTVFYGFDNLLADPLYLLKLWEGGMSFHGGLIGVMVALAIFARKRGCSFFQVADFLVPACPPGLFAGRMGNFINSELWGKPTDLPWGFKVGDQVVHPSQLYEAVLEGIVLFAIVWLYSARPRPTMAVSGVFLAGYGIFRFAVEFVRVPDAHIGDGGYLAFGWLTMGQVLSIPMVLLGAGLVVAAYLRGMPPEPEAVVAEPAPAASTKSRGGRGKGRKGRKR